MSNPCVSQRGSSRALYLAVYAALGAIVPFLSIYLKFLGMRADQIGAIIGIRPLVSAIVCPIWGWIADKYRCRRTVVFMSVFGWILFTTFLFLSPLIADVYEMVERNRSNHVTIITVAGDIVSGGDAKSTLAPLAKRYKPPNWGFGDGQNNHRLKGWFNQENNRPPRQQQANIATESSQTTVPKTTGIPNEPNKKQSISLVPTETGLSNEEKRFVFIILLAGFGTMQVFLSPVFPITDAVALQSLGPDTSQWGSQRMLGSFGYGTSCALVGLAMTQHVPDLGPAYIGKELKRFLPSFCVAQLFLLVAFIVASKVRFHVTDLRCHEYKVTLVTKMLASCSYGAYIATALYFGIAMGCTWTFLYWHLHNIGATYIQLGMATLSSCLGEAIGFLTVSKLITKHGSASMMVFALSNYSLRFIIYGYLTEPWLAIPTEILNGISFAFVWAASIHSLCGSTPNKSLASVTGILYGILAGLGLGIGSHLSGLLVTNYGAPVTFLYFALTTIAVTLVFAVTHWVIQRPHVQPDFPVEFSVSVPDLDKLQGGDSDDSDNIWAQS